MYISLSSINLSIFCIAKVFHAGLFYCKYPFPLKLNRHDFLTAWDIMRSRFLQAPYLVLGIFGGSGRKSIWMYMVGSHVFSIFSKASSIPPLSNALGIEFHIGNFSVGPLLSHNLEKTAPQTKHIPDFYVGTLNGGIIFKPESSGTPLPHETPAKRNAPQIFMLEPLSNGTILTPEHSGTHLSGERLPDIQVGTFDDGTILKPKP